MWFEGSVSAAIAKAKTESKLFVVFVGGTDEVSKTACANLESTSSKIQDKVVAIKLEAESENAKHFSQIYPVLIVPSTFVIKNGIPVEIIPQAINPDEFVSKIEAAAILSTETQPQSNQAVPPQAAAASTAPKEDKILLAQRKLAEIKEKKAKEEAELERQREASRRETGKAVLQAQKTREEAEMAAMLEERRRDKLMEKQAREKVLAEIARDREEKKRRLEMAKNPTQAPAPVVQAPTQPIVVGDSARIQFKFPDGHSVNRQFKSSEKLVEARNFVIEHASLDNFTLSTTYPRRVFSESEAEASFQDLGLVPSAVLMVIPKTERAQSIRTVASGNWTSQLPAFLLLPFLTLWNFILSFFVNTPTARNIEPRDQERPSTSTDPRTRQQRPPGQDYNRDGNVVRFRGPNDDDDDDENNTWNGNSTQQM